MRETDGVGGGRGDGNAGAAREQFPKNSVIIVRSRLQQPAVLLSLGRPESYHERQIRNTIGSLEVVR